MKPNPCYCEAHPWPHRYTVGKRGCYEYVGRDDLDERYDMRDGRTDADDAADSPTRGQAEAINRENAR